MPDGFIAPGKTVIFNEDQMPKYAVMNRHGDAFFDSHPAFFSLLLDKRVFVRIKGEKTLEPMTGRFTYEFDSEIYESVELYEEMLDVYEFSENGPTDEERKIFDMLYPGWCIDGDQ